jgi:integrase/recombinase XerC
MPEPVERHLHWMALKGRSVTTITARRLALGRLAAALPVPLLEALPEHLYDWRSGLGLADRTVAQYCSHARQFYAWAADNDLIAGNPASALPVPRPPRALPRPIAEDDLMAALAAAPLRIRPWLVLAAWCGLRAKEIAFLRRDAIMDTARPPVLIVASDATKGRRERVIPLSVFVLAELRAANLPNSGWAFRRHDGARGPNAPWLVSHLASEFLHSCGIPATLHQLRHRFGTMAYRAQRDLLAVQDLMGHQDPVSTAGYAAFDRPEARAAVEAIPAPRRLRTA